MGLAGMGSERLTVGAGLHAVNTETSVLLLDLAGLDGGKSLNGAQARVLGKGERHGIKCVGESAHGILLNAGALDSGVLNGEGASNLGSTATVDHTVIANKVANDTQSIV
jgi:hypothetical protein